MTSRTLLTLALCGSALLAASGPAAAMDAKAGEKGTACFYSSSISGWNYIDEHTVRVSVGPSKYLDLTLMGNARDLDFKQALAIKSDHNGQICEGNGLGLEVTAGGPVHRTWPITNVKLVKTPAGQ